MEFTNEELNVIITAVNAQYAKRIKINAENGISSNDDKYIEIMNEISKKAYNELTNRMCAEKQSDTM